MHRNLGKLYKRGALNVINIVKYLGRKLIEKCSKQNYENCLSDTCNQSAQDRNPTNRNGVRSRSGDLKYSFGMDFKFATL